MAEAARREPRHLRLLPEWLGQSGLWLFVPSEGIFEAVSAAEAGLPPEIAARLEAWMDEFDAIFDDHDPSASRFSTVGDFERWCGQGDIIAAAIRATLGPDERLEVHLPTGMGPE